MATAVVFATLALPAFGGAAVGPIPATDPTVLEFPVARTPVKLTFRNIGDQFLGFSFTYPAPINGFVPMLNEQSGVCFGSGLAPGQSCFYEFGYFPSGESSCCATFVFSGLNVPFFARPRLVPLLNATELGFGSRLTGTTSAPQTVTATNPSASPMTVTLDTAKPNFRVSGGTCVGMPQVVVAGNGTCTINYVFEPTSVGSFFADFFVNTPNGGRIVHVTGTGTGPVASLTPASWNFGSLLAGARPTATATLSNTGTSDLHVSSIEATDGPFEVAPGGTCTSSTTLIPGATCTIVYRVAADSDGDRKLQVVTDGGTVEIRLIVDFVAPSLSASPADVDFGGVGVGDPSTAHGITLTNNGDTPLVPKPLPSTSEFQTSSSCGTLAPGATCTANYVFTPSAVGARSGSLVFSADVPATGTTVSSNAVTVHGVGLDNVAPTITAPPDVTVEADGSCVASPSLGAPTASDNVGVVSVTGPAGATFPLGTTIVTWTATDAAGNSASAQQSVTVVDVTAPTITAPADATVADGGDTSPAAVGTATASDNCPGVAVTYSDSVTPGGGVTKTIVRTWTATDGSGNSASALQTIVESDTTPPSLMVPADVTVELGDDTSPASTGVATGSDLNGVTISYSDTAAGNTIARTWTATDGAGNSATGTQTITIADTNPPVLSVPPDATVELGGGTSPAATGSATATDPSAVSITFSDSVTPGCGATATIVRTWIATDASGNVASGTQTIYVVDTTAPALTAPANATVELGSDTSPAATGQATASDLSGPPAIAYSDAVTVGIPLVITRTWTATDACGNVSSAVQTITVVDTTPPAITAPPPVTVDTGPGGGSTVFLPDGVLGFATATDASGAVTIARSGVPAGNAFPIGTTTITYTATDPSGNQAQATQLVTVKDTTPPALTAPAAVGTSTGPGNTDGKAFVSDAALGSPVASDNSGVVTVTRSGVPAGNAFPIGTTTVTYTARDAAGNETTATQLVTVVDDTPPVVLVESVIVDATSLTGAEVEYFTDAHDNSGGPVSLVCTPPPGSFFPIGTTPISCTGTDPSGNTKTTNGAVTVNQRTPLTDLVDLSGECWDLGLAPPGIEQSLCGKLDQSARFLAYGKTSNACSHLQAFLSELNAQRRKHVSEAQYAVLDDAVIVRSRLGCR